MVRRASRIPLMMTLEPLSPLMTSMAKRSGRIFNLVLANGLLSVQLQSSGWILSTPA
jgi:hypothetical protein